FGDSKAVDIVKIGTVDYLLEQRDFMNVAGADTSYQNTIKKYFEEVPVESFGDRLFIYRLRSEYQVPKVFLPKRLYFAQLDPASVVERVSATEFKPQEVIIAADNQHWQGLEVTSPESKISFKKINPTKYVVKLEGTAKQAPLVLTESYNDNWKLHEITQSMYEKPAIFDTWPIFTWRGVREIAGNTHTVVNGYANGWVVSKGTKTASASVYLAIEYTPQHFFYVLRFLNFSLAVCLLIFYFTVPYKNKWRK
ncbi:hypothetical protein KKG63_01320, partial [Patescibacteria group bacterium]|nr:hypothetical protein [Patescibacteria group bacterium]